MKETMEIVVLKLGAGTRDSTCCRHHYWHLQICRNLYEGIQLY